MKRWSDDVHDLNLNEQITGAVQQYIRDVKSVDFPGDAEQY